MATFAFHPDFAKAHKNREHFLKEYLSSAWLQPDSLHPYPAGGEITLKKSRGFFFVFQPALPFAQENRSYLWAKWYPPPSSSPRPPPPRAQGKDPLIWVKSQ